MSCQPRLTSLSYPWVYYRGSLLLGGLPTKANEPHPPGVSLLMSRHVPAVALSFFYIQEVQHGGRSRTWGLHHSVDVLADYGAHPYQHSMTMLTPIYPINVFCYMQLECQQELISKDYVSFIVISMTDIFHNYFCLLLYIVRNNQASACEQTCLTCY